MVRESNLALNRCAVGERARTKEFESSVRLGTLGASDYDHFYEVCRGI